MMDMDDDHTSGPGVHQNSGAASAGSAQYVTCGDTITADAGCLMGHGTLQSDGKLIATVSGFVERVNKLISVRPLHSRYGGEVGDVVVGRVVELGDKRWKVDVGGRQHAALLLSSVNLPGGIQRRRTQEDSLNMRAFFSENDVISAEVQKLRHDGALSLHTRNLKYGKLGSGTLVRVAPNLIKRCKQHFQHLGPDIGVEVILGLNGFVWVQEAPVEREGKEGADGDSAAAAGEAEEGAPTTYTPVTLAGRERVCRVRNSILALARMLMPVYHATIADVYLASVAYGLPAKDMLSSQADLQRITQAAQERTQQA